MQSIIRPVNTSSFNALNNSSIVALVHFVLVVAGVADCPACVDEEMLFRPLAL
ncbi:hypothetical protein PR003_g29059 [Phytophthora rubi]|uniref:Uncharacterized protein n=1 Tax=Phytophthora rubi TaxID=129364 RepID=A0A6A4BMZ7_9STRA|nr:hypothetical protein PR003_g29059 [Phytophthora rubi]